MALVSTLGLLVGCTTNPTTGRSQFNALSRSDEIAMGVQSMPAMLKEYGGRVAKQELQDYVTSIGRLMAAQTEGDAPTLPWEFTLLDSDVINAFALPGGKVFMSRGLAERMTNEAQLAGVLGHEIGHVTARHINDQIARETGANLFAQVAGALAGEAGGAIAQAAPVVINYGGTAVLLKYSRDQESEADSLGMRYMAKVGYNPAAQKQVMEILAQASKGAGGPGGEFFATHPYPETRIKRINALLEKEYAGYQTNPKFSYKEEEFRAKFLNRLKAAFPEGRPFNQKDHELALASLKMPSLVHDEH
jgi:predicted Zn-dependent protease